MGVSLNGFCVLLGGDFFLFAGRLALLDYKYHIKLESRMNYRSNHDKAKTIGHALKAFDVVVC